MCTHPYTIPRDGKRVCILCNEVVAEIEEIQTGPCKMPPKIFEITPKLWEQVKPWPKIPFSVVEKCGWYISFIGFDQYLIMPIERNKEKVFYSARRLTNNGGIKYTYPVGRKRVPWVSSENLVSPIVFCEGYADAAYSSLVCSSVALLGNYYDRSLDDKIRGKEVVVALDGDAVGITSAVRIAKDIANVCSSRVAIFPDGMEPVDLELPALKEFYYERL